MAQSSGFFEAEWDAELYNEETQTYGDWDRKYLAEQFARYFQHFVSNGVMNDVANQLKVSAGSGMSVVVSPGFAFINGFWFYNDDTLALSVPLNESPSTRYDSVRIRWNASTRSIDCVYVADDIVNVRSDSYYDLQIAQVRVDASASVITDAVITDTRPNEELCGLVTIVKAEDVGDLGSLVTTDKSSIVSAINDVVSLIGSLDLLHTANKESVVKAINSFAWDILQSKPFDSLDAHTLSVKNVSGQKILSVDHTNDEIIIPHQEFAFVNQVCAITNSRITADSLADVYFDSSSISYAQQADISVETYDGYLVMTAEVDPTGTISGTIKVRVV